MPSTIMVSNGKEGKGMAIQCFLFFCFGSFTASMPTPDGKHSHICTILRKGPRLGVKRAGLMSKLCALCWKVNLLTGYKAEVTEQLMLRTES